MTREEIDRTLETITSASIPTVSALARIVADQEQRLRALEPCPGPARIHLWREDGTCAGCTTRKATT